MVDVFISYSRTDLAAVTRLAEAVEAEGYDVWWDADLPPHLSYGDVITDKIGMAKAAIVVWSKDSAASQWVRAEADMARNQNKLVQTAIDSVMPPLPFNQIQFAELGGWRGEADHPGWRKVKASLTELVGRPGDRAAAPLHRERAREPVAPPPPAKPSKWPLYGGIAIAALALLFAGWMVMRDNGDERIETTAEQPASAQPTPTATAAQPAAPVAAAPQQFAPPPAVAAAPEPEPIAAAPEPPPPAVASTQGMVFPDSSQRLIRPAEIANLGPATLAQARNEIYARKGFRFRRADMRSFFEQFDWYRPTTDNVRLTRIEQQNVAHLQAAEARFGT
jgi:hypothetical protein